MTITDDAANSPQTVTINGTAVTAVTIVAATGATLSVSVSAGQPAQFNLQATPSAGFNGTLAFACSGAPVGAACSAPSVTVSNGAAANFTVTVTTSGTAMVVPSAPGSIPRLRANAPMATTLLLFLLAFWFLLRNQKDGADSAASFEGRRVVALACLVFMLSGCGGGGSTSSVQPPPPVITPTGTYMLTITPTATPAGSAKTFPLSPITLTLVVK